MGGRLPDSAFLKIDEQNLCKIMCEVVAKLPQALPNLYIS
jgi:hypothetical protein